jgi:regulator of protease activity HflC (stomatin/prohibitin superfamily)
MREQFATLPGQELVTSDSVSVKLSILARYRIVDPKVATVEVADYHGAMYSLLQIGLRESVAARKIDDVLERREEIGPDVAERCAEKIGSLGLDLVSVDVRDLMFPGPLKKTFAQVLEARQQGLAALEKARGETAALRSLANAARMVESNPSLLQLRLVQQLEASRGHTVVLGFPSSSTPLPVRREGEAPELGAGDRTGDNE